MRLAQAAPALGVIVIYYPTGTRTIAVPALGDMLDAAMMAHDIWEDEGEQVRVRVIKFLPHGGRTCICHLPPNEEEWGP
jgi:hypothetical protein